VEVSEENDENNPLDDDEAQEIFHSNQPQSPQISLVEIFHRDQLSSNDHASAHYYVHDESQSVFPLTTLGRNRDQQSSTSLEEGDEEEKGEFLSQRAKIRQLRQCSHSWEQTLDPPHSQVDLHEEIDNRPWTSPTPLTHSISPTQPTQSQVKSTPILLLRYKEIITISDYDFNRRNIIIRVGAPIVFLLDPTTPSHVEHVIEGRSVHSQLCFMSEILQLPYSGQFVFVPQIVGEIFVTCQIYSDMGCRIVVINAPPPPPTTPVTPSTLSSGIYDAKRKIQQHTQTFSPRFPISATKFSQTLTGSFPVPQTIHSKHLPLSTETIDSTSSSLPPFSPNHQFGASRSGSLATHAQAPSLSISTNLPLSSSYLGVSEKFYLHSSTSSFGDANSVASSILDSDDGPDDDLYYFNTSTCLEPPLDQNTSENSLVNTLASSPLFTPYHTLPSSHLLPSHVHHDAIVYVEDFRFLPTHLVIEIGQRVLFQPIGHASMQKLSCNGEFEGVPLDSTDNSPSSHFLYTFMNIGTFRVINEIFSFMECEIIVSECDVVSDEQQVVDHPQKCDDETNDEIRKFHQHMNIQSLDGPFRPIPLMGSFATGSPKERISGSGKNDQISPLKIIQNHLRASVDLATEEFVSDEDEDVEHSDENPFLPPRLISSPPLSPKNQNALENIPISPIVDPHRFPSFPTFLAPPPSPVAVHPHPPSPPLIPSLDPAPEKTAPENCSKKKTKKNKKRKKKRKPSVSVSVCEEPELFDEDCKDDDEDDHVEENPPLEAAKIEIGKDSERPVMAPSDDIEPTNVPRPTSPLRTILPSAVTLQAPLPVIDTLSTSAPTILPPCSSITPPPSVLLPLSPTPLPSTPIKVNKLMNLLHTASAKKRSQTSQTVPKNPLDLLLHESLSFFTSFLPLSPSPALVRMERHRFQR
jgi:hypothetical protein